jgi:hypothetical protein
MRSLNWPHLMVSSGGSGYLVTHVDAEYYDVGVYSPKYYADSSNALNVWKGNGGHGYDLERLIYVCEVVVRVLESSSNTFQELNERQEVMALMELAKKVQECSTLENLQALGTQRASFGLHDWNIFSTCFIDLDPTNGQFFWQVRRHSNEFEEHSYMSSRLMDVSAMPMRDVKGVA